MPEDSWVKWPSETGWYWFFGIRLGKRHEDDKPELFPCKAINTRSEELTVHKINEYFYQEEWEGSFIKAALPDVKEIDNDNSVK